MFVYKQKLENTQIVLAGMNECIFISDRKIICRNREGKQLWENEFEGWSLNKIIKSNLFLKAKEGTIVFDIETGTSKKTLNFDIIKEANLQDDSSLIVKYGKFPKTLSKVSLKDEDITLIWQSSLLLGKFFLENKKHIILTSLDDKFISKNDQIISISQSKGLEIWEYDISELVKFKERTTDTNYQKGKILNFLDIYKSELLVAITNNTILAIDIETGKLKRKWRELSKGQYWWRKEWNFLCHPEQSVLVKEEGKIIGLCIYYYWEINLESGEIEFLDLTDYFKSERVEALQTGKITVKGDYIFFYSRNSIESYGGVDIKKVVVFNRRNKKIDWTHQFDFAYGTFFRGGAPTVDGGRLFVLNTEGELFIFEREEKT